ncbi:hypothetical protein BOX15_Mlig005107g1 [Macrostomum lignano]|uniref:Uncharacterized protein n=1 Tax=Macrostomum lignano TaxID=282301 RepID=A0A267EZY3_9PLAT|nr:hypothetical protein BOX15_Mlig005107g1 [Macrostomum lignano]
MSERNSTYDKDAEERDSLVLSLRQRLERESLGEKPGARREAGQTASAEATTDSCNSNEVRYRHSGGGHQLQQIQQQPAQPEPPCLSCLMRSLHRSGLVSACWSTAFAELEEAFAIKRVADAVASSGAPSDQSGGMRSQQHHPHLQQLQQLHQFLPGEKPTKWQALESLCSLAADLGRCPHRRA